MFLKRHYKTDNLSTGKTFAFYITKKELLPFNKKKTSNLIKKKIWIKDMKRHFI